MVLLVVMTCLYGRCSRTPVTTQEAARAVCFDQFEAREVRVLDWVAVVDCIIKSTIPAAVTELIKYWCVGLSKCSCLLLLPFVPGPWSLTVA